MVTWGVLRLPVATSPDGSPTAGVGGDGALAAGLSAHLDGALAITGDATLAGALAVLPPHVTRIVEIDATLAEDAATITTLQRLLAVADASTADAAASAAAPVAVVAARPMADALKHVEGDVVVSCLDRDGLMLPCRPFVLDRATLAAALADAAADGRDGSGDAVALLLAAGRPVLIVPPVGDPITVRTAPDGTVG
jgi:hypothetical protein